MTRDRKYPSMEQMLADARRPQRIEGPTAALRPTSHLVVGFDRCPASHRALRFAIELAAPLNAYLHVAHIIDLQDFPVDPDGDDWEQYFADTLDQERATACDLLSALPGNWTYYAHRGDPAHVLAALADTYDALMIILGTACGGLMSAIDRFLGASVSARLIRHTHRPVVLVPDTSRTDETDDARTSSRRRHGELHRITKPTTPGADVGIGAAEPAESTVVARALPETLRGNGFGVLGLVQAIGDKGSTVVAGLLWSLLSPAIAFGYVAAWTLLSVSPATVPAGTVSLRVRNTGTLTHRVVVLPLAQGRFPDSVSVVSTARSTSPTVMAKSRELAAPTTRTASPQQRPAGPPSPCP